MKYDVKKLMARRKKRRKEEKIIYQQANKCKCHKKQTLSAKDKAKKQKKQVMKCMTKVSEYRTPCPCFSDYSRHQTQLISSPHLQMQVKNKAEKRANTKLDGNTMIALKELRFVLCLFA